MKIKFSKYHGNGNDFIIISETEITKITNISDFVKKVTNRNFGIGADGLIYASTKKNNKVFNYYNQDGSRALMCGNGIRCFAKFIEDEYNLTFPQQIITDKDKLLVKKENQNFVVSMGQKNKIQVFEYKHLQLNYIFLQVDHCVVFVDDFDFNVNELGSEIENLTNLFENKTNVNFVKIANDNEIFVKTWERGCGQTLACGSGMCASAVVFSELNNKSGKVKVSSLGGKLNVETNEDIIMDGPVKFICSGEYNYEEK